jgi:glycosyltransferase involved in cell wall biosynthesis
MWAMMSYMLFPIVIMRALGVRVPYVLSLQEGDPFEHVFKRPHVALLSPLLRYGFRHARVTQAISTYLSSWASAMGYRGSVEVIPNGADMKTIDSFTSSEVTDVAHSLSKKEGDIFLVTASRLVEKNAVDDVIRALPHLPEHVSFVVIGTGKDEGALKALAQKEGVTNRVRFLGFVEQSQIGKYLKAADIFVRASRSEGMGNSFIEAMAAGVPVVGTQVGGIADFLFDEKRNPEILATGWAVDADSPKDIARAVLSIIVNPEKTRATVAHARSVVEHRHDWNFIASEFEQKVLAKI